jgi:hypothetical protein
MGDPSDGPFPRFLGKGFWGFNTTTGRYEGFWIDNASTSMQMEVGDVDSSGKVWTMHTEVIHPATRQPMKRRSVIELIDEDRHQMETFVAGDDQQDLKVMEIEYERAA